MFCTITLLTVKIIIPPVYFLCGVLIGSGPKGRGFESRHFDRKRNPGSIRFPGSLLFPGDLWRKCGFGGKLGEESGRRRSETLRGNGLRLGEMGETLTIIIIND